MNVKRFGVSLEENLLVKLDVLVKKQRFPNRSQAIRFLIQKNLLKKNGIKHREFVMSATG